MNKKEWILFCLESALAGGAVGLGAIAFLSAKILSHGIEGTIVGALLFSLGMLIVVLFDMKLFTEMVAELPRLNYKKWGRLAVCFAGNALGIGLVSLVARFSFLGDKIVSEAASIVASKITADYWPIKAFCSAVMCGLLFTFSVRAKEFAPKKNLGVALGVLFPILVFAFCGFDHSVANMLYIYYYGAEAFAKFPLQILSYVVIVVLGNLVGGTVYPLFLFLKEKWGADGKGKK